MQNERIFLMVELSNWLFWSIFGSFVPHDRVILKMKRKYTIEGFESYKNELVRVARHRFHKARVTGWGKKNRVIIDDVESHSRRPFEVTVDSRWFSCVAFAQNLPHGTRGSDPTRNHQRSDKNLFGRIWPIVL